MGGGITLVYPGLFDRARWLFSQPRGWISLVAWEIAALVLVGLPYGPGAFVWAAVIVAAFVLVFATLRDRRRRYAPPHTLRDPKGINTIREDERAGFFTDRKGYLWRKRLFFSASGIPTCEVLWDWYRFASSFQTGKPVLLLEEAKLSWWWFENGFYIARSDYSADDVAALVRQQARRRQQRLEHAHDLMAIDTNGTARPGIPEEVKRFVFRRDGGKCVQCGSSELLHFDHIIPVALGGGHTAENLQLLCATCNREKAASL
jgi:hypothetical protein